MRTPQKKERSMDNQQVIKQNDFFNSNEELSNEIDSLNLIEPVDTIDSTKLPEKIMKSAKYVITMNLPDCSPRNRSITESFLNSLCQTYEELFEEYYLNKEEDDIAHSSGDCFYLFYSLKENIDLKKFFLFAQSIITFFNNTNLYRKTVYENNFNVNKVSYFRLRELKDIKNLNFYFEPFFNKVNKEIKTYFISMFFLANKKLNLFNKRYMKKLIIAVQKKFKVVMNLNEHYKEHDTLYAYVPLYVVFSFGKVVDISYLNLQSFIARKSIYNRNLYIETKIPDYKDMDSISSLNLSSNSSNSYFYEDSEFENSLTSESLDIEVIDYNNKNEHFISKWHLKPFYLTQDIYYKNTTMLPAIAIEFKHL